VPEGIALQRWGTSGPTLLCLHGLGGSAEFFAELGAPLAAACRIVAFDLPGSGLSAVPPAVSFEALASITAEVARGLESPIYLLGHSMGTIIGLEALRQAPRMASGFLAVGGLMQARPDARERISARLAIIEERGMLGLGPTVAAANVSARTNTARPDIVARIGDIFERQPQAGYVATARALIGWAARPLPLLDGVRCLAITGAEDRYAPPDDVRAFAALLPGAPTPVVLEDCAHLPFLENPTSFGQIVERYLTGG
jgi:3-oxoadipate enol-lactonase